ncbi:MAG: polysaccharide biosynthesis/export family protein [Archangium sp.]|nr:polysaccharide biosynthesis/export family protein [Archangium sp.]MDP3151703.1 polysaccharide biosynthesis/export family protein [Archangium sp.]MDP3573221.1 polysaccharide biosynthesis/export family protein [Archangium sp.]
MRWSWCCFILLSCAHAPRGSCELNAALESLASRHPVTAPLVETGGELDVSVASEPSLSGHYRVGPGGKIEFPFCGPLTVADLDAAQASRAIADCLRAGYVRDPEVTVRIGRHTAHRINVIGQVRAPRSVDYVRGMTLSQAIVAAGGLTCSASESVVIKREPADRSSLIRLRALASGETVDVPLRPSDVIFVSELP